MKNSLNLYVSWNQESGRQFDQGMISNFDAGMTANGTYEILVYMIGGKMSVFVAEIKLQSSNSTTSQSDPTVIQGTTYETASFQYQIDSDTMLDYKKAVAHVDFSTSPAYQAGYSHDVFVGGSNFGNEEFRNVKFDDLDAVVHELKYVRIFENKICDRKIDGEAGKSAPPTWIILGITLGSMVGFGVIVFLMSCLGK